MDQIFVLLLVALTSFCAYRVLKQFRPDGAASMSAAFRAFWEWIGAFTLFLTANLGLGMLIILAVRGFTPRFVALYALENLLLFLLSAAQAFVFQQWTKRPM